MFLFIDNYDSFSWNLVQAFYALGRKPVVRANDDPHILELAASPELEAVCISPGPSHPRNAGLCLEFLKRLPASVPVLGVCLGHQLLGYFAGAEVSRAPYVMHGKSSDIIHDGAGLFAGLPNPMTVAVTIPWWSSPRRTSRIPVLPLLPADRKGKSWPCAIMTVRGWASSFIRNPS